MNGFELRCFKKHVTSLQCQDIIDVICKFVLINVKNYVCVNFYAYDYIMRHLNFQISLDHMLMKRPNLSVHEKMFSVSWNVKNIYMMLIILNENHIFLSTMLS